jgi:phospholipase/carboxylesterase
VLAAVRAPLAPPFPPGWSWFDRGSRRPLERAVTAAADALIAWIDRATDAETIGILGFSQGAAVALQALRLQPERFAFVVNLAGYADPSPLPGDEALAERRPRSSGAAARATR